MAVTEKTDNIGSGEYETLFKKESMIQHNQKKNTNKSCK